MSFALKDAANWIKSDVCVKITVFTGFNLISLVFFARFVHQSIFSQSSHVGWEILSQTNNCVSMKRQNSKSKQCFSVICTVFSRTAHTFCRYYFIKISDIVKWCAWNNNNVNKNSESFSLHWKFIFVLFFEDARHGSDDMASTQWKNLASNLVSVNREVVNKKYEVLEKCCTENTEHYRVYAVFIGIINYWVIFRRRSELRSTEKIECAGIQRKWAVLEFSLCWENHKIGMFCDIISLIFQHTHAQSFGLGYRRFELLASLLIRKFTSFSVSSNKSDLVLYQKKSLHFNVIIYIHFGLLYFLWILFGRNRKKSQTQ